MNRVTRLLAVAAFSAVLGAGVAGCAAGGVQQAGATDKSARTAQADGEKKKESRLVCESVKRTGSHMTDSYCYTRAEKEEQRQRAREQMDRLNQNTGTRAGDGN